MAEQLEIRIREGISPDDPLLDRLVDQLTGLSWRWTVCKPGALLALAQGYARTEEKARARAERAARRRKRTSYSYMVDTEED